MKYNADVNGRTTELELSGTEDELRIGPADSATQASLEAIGNGRYILRIGAKVIDGYVIATEDGFEVYYQGRPYSVSVVDERAAALAKLSGHRTSTGGTIKAPMPGMVKAVNVTVGDHVQRGASLVVLEAMKMENDLSAPAEGTVKEIRVAAGDKVNQGQVLVVLE